ncbi:MAG TPA: sugar ABC transporter permease [Candidatus Hydrogenedentes bacterium]|nr:sugar ABC transporter permease [Candidatus Hydrogenedentota bacterium]HOL77771.1 sugar ABC transporter permease [Candidatus Hydrogenedentota bacterium]HPO86415.1 sugar ABC transporter permease [Candidatus Hydrogenedentota bacterium]
MTGGKPFLTRLQNNGQGYLFAAPWLLGFFCLTVGPMVFSLFLCFFRWDGITSFRDHAAFVGLENFRRLANDELFFKAFWNTAFYAFLSVPLGVAASLMLATLLNAKVRGIALFRTLFYLPNVLAGVATIMVWFWLLNPEFGALNFLLKKVGIIGLVQWGIDHIPGVAGLMARWELSWPPLWLADESWAKPALILMSLWNVGGGMLIYLAGLQNVPQHLYEVAEIDGAGRLRRFVYITIPMLTPTIFFHLVMSIIGSFQVFTQSFIMTNGGPNNATLFYVLYLYRKAFQHFEMGYASVLAWILFAVILGLTLMVLRSSRLWVYYEGERR